MTNSLKFYKGDFSLLGLSSYVNGGIYFDTKSHQIRVGNGSATGYDAFGSNIKDVKSVGSVLTISFWDGNDITINLGDCASATQVAAELKKVTDRVSALETSVGGLDTRVGTLETAVGESGLGGRVGTLESDVATVKTSVGDLDTRVDTLETTVGAIKIPVTGVQDGDKILSLDGDKVHSTLSMIYEPGDDGKYYIKLVGKNDTLISSIDCTDFLVDGMLKSVTKVTIAEGQATSERPAGDYFKFDFDGAADAIYVPLSDFAVSTYKAGKDLDLNGDTFDVALDKDVTIAGGPLANNVLESGDVWPWTNDDGANIIPAGMSLSEILSGLFLKVKNGTVTSPVYSWNPTLAAPTVTLGGKTSQTLEVGATVAVAVTPSSSVSGNAASVSVSASEGYFTSPDGTWNAGSYSQTVSGSVSGTASASATYGGSSVADGDTVTVGEGTTTLSATASGITASVADFDAATIYASTTTKKVLSDTYVNVDTNYFASNKPLTSSKSAIVTGLRACWYGFLDSAPVESALTNAYFRGITDTNPTGNGIKKSLSGITTGTEIVAKSGFKGLVIAIPSGKEIKSLIAKGATTDLIPAATTITVDIEGENGYAATPYNVYYCAWAEGGDDSTYVVTLK